MTKQIDLWASEFGEEYAARNLITPDTIRRLTRDWCSILQHAKHPAPESALEVGCNIGRNLVALRALIPRLSGIEPNARVVSMAHHNALLRGVEIKHGTGFSLPFADRSFDLVFTSGVLIHVAPEDLGRMTDEIVRVAKKYVVAIEYFSHEPVSISYHGKEGYLFKRDYGSFYLDRYSDLQVVSYGFFWQRFDSADDANWWLFRKM